MFLYNEADTKAHYASKSREMKNILDDLEQIVIESKVSLEGNSFYYHNSLHIFLELYNKQLNLFWCGKQASTRICEIGFNAGHSTMLMLLGRDTTPLDFTIFDIGEHAYTNPTLNYIVSKFPHIKFEYVEGDSTQTMPKWIKDNPQYLETYDVIHVDGGHTEKCIFNDMKNVDLLVKKGGIIIIDDTQDDIINKYVDLYISTGQYQELKVLNTIGYRHRIIWKSL
jgi:3D (Asp-Asp-Asp) domain-containing protein